MAAAVVGLWERTRARQSDVMPRAQLRALGVVAAGDRMTCGGLGRQLGLTPSAASRLCARMEAGGLLDREPAARDRRTRHLVLTPAGRKTLRETRERQRRTVHSLLENTGGVADISLTEALDDLRLALEEELGAHPRRV
ncbi:MarR family winged helix-turn-helix transcriptional regulator [Streptomyces sodiiphilus]|uniref:MarR family winged helix-turn-helix transcriptional regulator n=1 Tax=Streptomyces sodiiphilus TaxID=226217 RepID=UPI0031E2153A